MTTQTPRDKSFMRYYEDPESKEVYEVLNQLSIYKEKTGESLFRAKVRNLSTGLFIEMTSLEHLQILSESESARIYFLQFCPSKPDSPSRQPVATGFSDNLGAEARLENRRVNFGRSGEYP